MSNPTATRPATVGLGAGSGTRRIAAVAWVVLAVALVGAIVALAVTSPGHVRPAGRFAAPTAPRYLPVVHAQHQADGPHGNAGPVETAATRFDGGPQEGSRGESPRASLVGSPAPGGQGFTAYRLRHHGG